MLFFLRNAMLGFGLLGMSVSASAKTGLQTFADVGAVGLPLIALGLTAADDDLDEGGWQLAYTGGASLLATTGLKYIVNAKRPNGGDKGFPSGHTSTAFFAAAYLEDRYGWEVGLPAHILAAAVGWSRIDTKDHNLGQVIAGAAIGELSAYLFTTRRDDTVRFFPWSDPERQAVGMTMIAKF